MFSLIRLITLLCCVVLGAAAWAGDSPWQWQARMGADNGPAMLPDGYRNKVYDHPKDAQDDLSKLAELAGLKVRANQSNPNYPNTKTLYYRVPNSPILGFEVGVSNGAKVFGGSADAACSAAVATWPDLQYVDAVHVNDPRTNDPNDHFRCRARNRDGNLLEAAALARPYCPIFFAYDTTAHECVNPYYIYLDGTVNASAACNASRPHPHPQDRPGGRGNPIMLGKCNKMQWETDYIGGGPFPLQMQRVYSHIAAGNSAMGSGWRHYYDRRLIRIDMTGTLALRPNHAQIWFDQAKNTDLDNWAWLDGTILYLGNGDVETYDQRGFLVEIRRRDGRWQRLTYNSGDQIDQVSDEFGNVLTFNYDSDKTVLLGVTLADGKTIQYTRNGPLLSAVTYPDTTKRTYIYGEDAKPTYLTGIVDERNVRYANFTYLNEQAKTTSHAGGVDSHSFTINTPTWTTVVDPLGTTYHHFFQQQMGALRHTSIKAFCCDGNSREEKFTYDAQGNQTSYTDFNGVLTTYEYDLSRNLETRRVVASGTPQARTIVTGWHSVLPLPARIVEPNRTTEYTYNDLTGQVLSTTITGQSAGGSQQSRTWRYRYNSLGLLDQIDGPRTDVADLTSFGYDAKANLASITNALGHVTQIGGYDVHGRPASITDANGVVSSLVYHSRGWLTQISRGGLTTRYDYHANGNIARITQPDGSNLRYDYDDANRLTAIVDNAGNRIAYTRDNAGNPLKTDLYDPSGQLRQTQSQVYDGLQRLIRSVDAGGNSTQYQYDNLDQPTAQTRPLHPQASQVYDPLQRLIRAVDPAGGTTQFGYDNQHRLTDVTDPNNHVTRYSYDGLGNLTQINSPDSGSSSATYDSAGNALTRTDARGKTATYGYDALDRVTQIAYGDETHTYTWDTCTNGKGRLCKITDKSGNTTWSYDSLGRVAQKVQTVGSLTMTQSWTYDAYGRLASHKYPSGAVVSYIYDSLGNVSGISVNGQALITTTSYQPFGPPQGWAWGNGSNHIRLIDANGNLSRIQGSDTRDYQYDAAQRLTGIAANDPKYNQTYSYNALDHLTAVAVATGGPIPAQSYSHDAIGNRTGQTLGSAASSFVIDSASNKLLSSSGSLSRSIVTDAAGNISQNGAWTYTYNNGGRLTKAVKGSTSLTFGYNAQGQRVSKSAGNLNFAYNQAGQLIGEYKTNGTLVQEVVWLGHLPVASLRPANTLAALDDDELPDMEPLRVTATPDVQSAAVTATSVKMYYLEADHLGTPRKAIDPANNKVIWRWDSDAYGTTKPNEDPDGNGKKFVFNLRFAGQYFDTETGLHQNYYRDYDPALGRYLQSDPIGLAGGLNTFAYVGANPLGAVDPQGLAAWGFDTLLKYSDTLKDLVTGALQQRKNNQATMNAALSGDPAAQNDVAMSFAVGFVGSIGGNVGKIFRGCVGNNVAKGVENIANFKSLNEARAAARQLSGLGDDAVDFIQELGPYKGQITGRMSPDGSRGWRIDFDPNKGFHVNWWDRSAGPKRTDWLYGANQIEGGTLDQYVQTLQHFPKK